MLATPDLSQVITAPRIRFRRTDQLHVTHAVLSLDCGGLERIVADLVRMGQSRGQRVSVLCLERPGALQSKVEDLGARLISLHKPPGLRLGYVSRARAALASLQPDVVHSHQAGALLYIGSAAWRNGIRAVVHTEHGNHLLRARGWKRRFRYRLLIGCASRCCGRVCCVSSDIAEAIGTWGFTAGRKIHVVPNGIDCSLYSGRLDQAQTRASLGIPPETMVIGTVGRLHEVKRQDLLIRAFAITRHRFPNAHLVLVGDGPARDNLRSVAQSLDLDRVVHFTGYQAEPQRFLAIMNVFALTSRTEGMPLAILEAWAAGLPIAASAVGGVRELIGHGQTGLLFPEGDLNALAATLDKLLGDRAAATALGMAGQTRVRSQFSLERMAANYENHYREMLHATSVS